MNILNLNMQLANAGSIYRLREMQADPSWPAAVYLTDVNGELVDEEPLEGNVEALVQEFCDAEQDEQSWLEGN